MKYLIITSILVAATKFVAVPVIEKKIEILVKN